MYIYALLDPTTKVIRYIGATKNFQKRYTNHLYDTSHTHKNCWIKSLRKRGLLPDMMILKKVSQGSWQDEEKQYIKYYKEQGVKLTNSTDGGEGILNPPLDVRQKISRSQIGKIISEKTKKKLSESHLGQKPWNKGIVGCGKGRIVSMETRLKTSKTLMGQKHPKWRIEKNRVGHLGQSSWNKGKKFSLESRQKMSESMKGRIPWNKGLKKDKNVQ